MESILKCSTALGAVDHGEDLYVAYSSYLKGFVTYAEDGPTTRCYWLIVRDSFPLLCHVEAGTRVSIPVSRFVIHIRGASLGDVGIGNTG